MNLSNKLALNKSTCSFSGYITYGNVLIIYEKAGLNQFIFYKEQ